MSNREPTNPASMIIRALDGATTPGGCNHCDAEQMVVADGYGPNMHKIEIRHDDWCPFLRSLENR